MVARFVSIVIVILTLVSCERGNGSKAKDKPQQTGNMEVLVQAFEKAVEKTSPYLASFSEYFRNVSSCGSATDYTTVRGLPDGAGDLSVAKTVETDGVLSRTETRIKTGDSEGHGLVSYAGANFFAVAFPDETGKIYGFSYDDMMSGFKSSPLNSANKTKFSLSPDSDLSFKSVSFFSDISNNLVMHADAVKTILNCVQENSQYSETDVDCVAFGEDVTAKEYSFVVANEFGNSFLSDFAQLCRSDDKVRSFIMDLYGFYDNGIYDADTNETFLDKYLKSVTDIENTAKSENITGTLEISGTVFDGVLLSVSIKSDYLNSIEISLDLHDLTKQTLNYKISGMLVSRKGTIIRETQSTASDDNYSVAYTVTDRQSEMSIQTKISVFGSDSRFELSCVNMDSNAEYFTADGSFILEDKRLNLDCNYNTRIPGVESEVISLRLNSVVKSEKIDLPEYSNVFSLTEDELETLENEFIEVYAKFLCSNDGYYYKLMTDPMFSLYGGGAADRLTCIITPICGDYMHSYFLINRDVTADVIARVVKESGFSVQGTYLVNKYSYQVSELNYGDLVDVNSYVLTVKDGEVSCR